MFAAGQTEAVCCGVSNKSAALTSRIKETARNDEITSACICHDYLRGVRCTVRGRRSRQRPRLFSKNLVSGVPGLETITDSSLVNPWDVSFANGGSPIWISNQGANMAPLYPMTGSAGVAAAPFTVNIPTTASGPQGPTGEGRQRIDVANGRNRN